MIGLVAAILTFGYFYILKPKYESIAKEISATNEEKENKKADMVRILSRLSTYRNNYNAISHSDRERVEYLLPADPAPEILFLQMENLADQLGLLLVSLTVQPKTNDASQKKPISQKVTNIKVQGVELIAVQAMFVGVDYKGLKMLLRRVEKNIRLMDITNLEFNPGAQTAVIELNTYYLN
ncbi:hypothetical protein KAJ89_06215 [Candidatus Parcubacteria bacterium]|nr:hypothetical protein [Candidatus Parcubacteria bacterium]